MFTVWVSFMAIVIALLLILVPTVGWLVVAPLILLRQLPFSHSTDHRL